MKNGDTPDAARLVYATYPSLEEAKQAAAAFLSAGLIACANVSPGMVAIYTWEGAVQTDEEVAVIFKTTAAQSAALISAIEANHPYDVPAILVLPVTAGSTAFMDWIATTVAPRS